MVKALHHLLHFQRNANENVSAELLSPTGRCFYHVLETSYLFFLSSFIQVSILIHAQVSKSFKTANFVAFRNVSNNPVPFLPPPPKSTGMTICNFCSYCSSFCFKNLWLIMQMPPQRNLKGKINTEVQAYENKHTV